MTAVLVEAGPDVGLPWHYGDPLREQRGLVAGRGAVDLSNRTVFTLVGADRLAYLHAVTTQDLEGLAPGASSTAYVLSPTGHIEHVIFLVDDGEVTWCFSEPGSTVAAWLDSMRFAMRVTVTPRPDLGIVWRAGAPAEVPWAVRRGEDSLGGHEVFVPRADLDAALGDVRAGTWAYDALRIAAGVPRVGVDTDERTIPNELGVPGPAVHLDKGCYRGQETVARVHTLGRPPRRLVLLHLDGSPDHLPTPGAPVLHGEQTVGFVGSATHHHELGPIALGLVKRSVPVDATLTVEGVAAAQEPLVDPEVGLHVRPRL